MTGMDEILGRARRKFEAADSKATFDCLIEAIRRLESQVEDLRRHNAPLRASKRLDCEPQRPNALACVASKES